jgi:hypothetical protein
VDDLNTPFRERRERARRHRRARRVAAAVVLPLVAAGLVAAALARGGSGDDEPNVAGTTEVEPAAATRRSLALGPRQPPIEMRGVHVTMALASIPGKLEEYLKLPGLNTVQLDIKDENGEVGFVPSSVPLARAVGAAKPYYRPRAVVDATRRHGVYLIGRIVCFEDPVLAERRPAFAIKRRDGSVWENSAGLGWTNPYNRRVWDYIADLGEASARLGFDEIQLDYVRFPSDGDVDGAVYPGRTATPPGWTIPQFVQYVSKRLKRHGVRVSVDVFGLAATRDLGIGQIPRRISRYVDAVYPMVYPSHYVSGEFDLPDPNASPGPTVARSLADFQRELQGRKATLIPWLQDFSLGRTYTLADVRAQIDATFAAGSPGFLLWNAAGIYTADALTYRPKPR